MSRGKNLQEMEVKTQQSKTAANANAKPGDPMPSLSGTTPGQTGSYEDLGGPTPENYKTDDDSAKEGHKFPYLFRTIAENKQYKYDVFILI